MPTVLPSRVLAAVRDEQGQDLIEYAFLASFVALVVVASMSAIGTALTTHFTNVSTQISSGS